jgi:nitroimidazol reductase NimA-like FMN-containing flavoprotein (pyridoxamine 5'-phosphate oxidase superfamily)
MALGYLAYLETTDSPNASHATLARLAGALGVQVAALTGAGMEQPPGQSHGVRHAALEEMTVDDCRARLAPGGVGRFLYTSDRGPVAVPVNFAMLGDDVVFRTPAGGAVADATAQDKVSFDVDHIDDALSEGWSVLVSGKARVLTDPAEVQQAAALDIQPWPGGDRNAYVRLAPAEITGRRIRVPG